MSHPPLEQTELILGNSNPKFSGVTSTMLQVLEYQKKLLPVAVLGSHHLPDDVRAITFREALRLCKTPLPDGKARVFHARRNNEMLQALALKKLSPTRLKIAFTSTAQRPHTWITRWLIREADAVISTCTAAAAYIKGGADIISPHGVDLQRYRPATDRAALWQEFGFPGKYGIGIFGRVRHQKGIDILVEAALPLLADYPDFTIVVCGETTSQHQKSLNGLKAKIAAAGLEDRFVFLGKQPFAALPELFRAMHLVTALSRNEGFGLTVLEAMASGTAVLASEAGAWQDIVRPGETGYLVPCGDVPATRDKLENLLCDVPRLEAMGRNGRRRAEVAYSLENEAEALTEFLRSLQMSE
ncbi:MAG: glycosyltransferase [Verrucomicrobia bacterium]|jgi:mannosyltransferase|nr:glycosyltransferase [Verrucomicrobiota bacterium]